MYRPMSIHVAIHQMNMVHLIFSYYLGISTIRVEMGCSCGAVGEGFPRRYLAHFNLRTRAGCFSCQLSNSICKKVDAPRRGCTYGP